MDVEADDISAVVTGGRGDAAGCADGGGVETRGAGSRVAISAGEAVSACVACVEDCGGAAGRDDDDVTYAGTELRALLDSCVGAVVNDAGCAAPPQPLSITTQLTSRIQPSLCPC